DRDRRDVHAIERAQNPGGDGTAVGYQDFAERRHWLAVLLEARRPGVHEVLADAVRQALPVHLEHPDQVVARVLGADDALHRVHGGHIPRLAVLIHLREGRIETRLPRLQAVHDLHREGRVHEAHLGGRPRRHLVRVPPAAHVAIGLPGALAQDDRDLAQRAQLQRLHIVHDLARRAFALGLDPDREAGRVDQQHQRNIEAVAQHEEARDLLAGVGVHRAALEDRVVGDEADGTPTQPRKTRHRHLAETGLELEEAALVDHGADDVSHVVDLRALLGQQLDDTRHGLAGPWRNLPDGWRLLVV